jgi:S1-C subfamily serine protease
LLSLDGTPISSDKTLRRLLADYRWGDVLKAVIRRDGKETALDINLRRAR